MKGTIAGAEPWALPPKWSWQRIEDVAPVNRKRPLNGTRDDELLPFVPMACVAEGSGKIDISQLRPAVEVRKGYTRFQSGDVLFAKITPCMENGKIAIVPPLDAPFGAGSTEFHVLSPERVESRYLYYWLSQHKFRQEAEFNMTGTAGQKRVPPDYLRNALIPVPEPETQRRIVARIDELFSELDDGEQELRRARAELETYRKALLKAAVTGELTADWRAANPPKETGADLLQRILADRRARWQADPKNKGKRYKEPVGPDTANLPKLPEGWTWASLDQLAWASSYGTSQKCAPDGVGEPVLRIPNLRGGKICLGDLKRALSPLSYANSEYLNVGDLLIIRTNGSDSLIGRTGVVTAFFDQPTHFASYLIRFRIVGSQARWRWVRAFTESTVFRAKVLASIGSSAGQYNLSLSRLERFPLAIPCDEEIEAALSMLASGELELPDELGEQADTLRQSILAAAFRGELVQ